MTNENTEYEKLAQEIYQAISDAEEVKNITVQHDVKLPRKSGCNHQIDVYWEVELMRKKHRVAIECKNYLREVSVGKVRDFFGALYDIGKIDGEINGILITKVGYQSGAKQFAAHYGISLKELRPPTAKDWEGRIKTIELSITAFYSNIKQRTIDWDRNWLLENSDGREGDVRVCMSGMSDEMTIVDSSGHVLTTLHEIENSLPRDQEQINKVVNRQFSDAFLIDASGQRLKINGIEYLYDVVSESETLIAEGEAIAKAILRDVSSGAIKFFDQTGNVREVRHP